MRFPHLIYALMIRCAAISRMSLLGAVLVGNQGALYRISSSSICPYFRASVAAGADVVFAARLKFSQLHAGDRLKPKQSVGLLGEEPHEQLVQEDSLVHPVLVDGHGLVKQRLETRLHLRESDFSSGCSPLSSNQDKVSDGGELDDLDERQVIEWAFPNHSLDQLETFPVHHDVDEHCTTVFNIVALGIDTITGGIEVGLHFSVELSSKGELVPLKSNLA